MDQGPLGDLNGRIFRLVRAMAWRLASAGPAQQVIAQL
jgi:hypothetical protein